MVSCSHGRVLCLAPRPPSRQELTAAQESLRRRVSHERAMAVPEPPPPPRAPLQPRPTAIAQDASFAVALPC
eukprot:11138329-Alexandrium_andersonii.AAC.1